MKLLLSMTPSVSMALLAASSLAVAADDAMPLNAPIQPELEASIMERLHALVYDANIVDLVSPREEGSPSPPLNAHTKFDLYVLAQSWQPEFCHGKEKVYPGCQKPQEFWKTHLTLHGLWPERETSAPPSFCDGEPFDAQQVEDEIGFETLTQYWPDVKFSVASPEYPSFWEHEWTRHGTCSGLAQIEYFSHAVNLIRNGTVDTPTLVQENVGEYVPIADLRAAFGSGSSQPAAVLKCMHGGGTLSQVFTCWLKDRKNVPIQRRACPEHVLKEDTCLQSSIYIPAFSEHE
ncbi:Ribonuclease ddi, partial [Globisporangium splendens]